MDGGVFSVLRMQAKSEIGAKRSDPRWQRSCAAASAFGASPAPSCPREEEAASSPRRALGRSERRSERGATAIRCQLFGERAGGCPVDDVESRRARAMRPLAGRRLALRRILCVASLISSCGEGTATGCSETYRPLAPRSRPCGGISKVLQGQGAGWTPR